MSFLSPFDATALPEDWRLLRLRHALVFVSRGNAPTYDETGDALAVGQTCIQWSGFKASAARRQARPEHVRSLKGYLQRGDVLLNSTGVGTLGRAAIFPGADEDFVADGHVTILRTRPNVLDPRFLTYVLASRQAQSYIDAALVVGATKQTELSRDRLLDLAIPVPPLERQRELVASLDEHQAHTRVVVEAKARLLALLDEREVALRDGHIAEAAGSLPLVPLMHLVDPGRPVQYGILMPGPNVSSGPLVVDAGDVERGRLGAQQLRRTTPEIEAPFARSRIRAGDLLMSIRGSFGTVAQASPELDGANVSRDVARIAPREGVDRRWLLHALSSRFFYGQLEATVMGSAVRGVNIRNLKRCKVPLPDLAEQRRVAETLDAFGTRHAAFRASLQEQVRLLGEHEQALISAAVSGSPPPAVASHVRLRGVAA